jgi:hypothetical protein
MRRYDVVDYHDATIQMSRRGLDYSVPRHAVFAGNTLLLEVELCTEIVIHY